MGSPVLDEVKNAAFLCEALYGQASIDWGWDYRTNDDAVIYWGLKRVANVAYVCFRGSTTVEDWLKDFNAFADPFTVDGLGPVHPGFFQGMPDVWTEIKSKLNGEAFILTGHSLGSGEADICAGLAVLDNRPPAAKIGFGSPKAGFKQLGNLLKNIPDYCFRNTNGINWDLITSVPFTFFPEEYQHTAPLFNVCAQPVEDDSWGPFAWHRMQYYREAISGLTEAALAQHAHVSTLRRQTYFNAITPSGARYI
jgi:Lipase (class 3)